MPTPRGQAAAIKTTKTVRTAELVDVSILSRLTCLPYLSNLLPGPESDTPVAWLRALTNSRSH